MAALPLEKQQTKIVNLLTDKLEAVSVLDKKVCRTKIPKFLYTLIPGKIPQLNLHDYSSMVEKIVSNLKWILSLSHVKFWCQIIHDQGLHETLDSYLKLAPRYQSNDWPSQFMTKHNELHKLVFMVFLRMSTPKESERDFISADVFGNLLYDNFLFDIPRIMDLCSLYGCNRQNQPLLKKLVESVFKNQDGYLDDLKQAAGVVIEVLNEVEAKITGTDGSSLAPVKLSERNADPLMKLSHIEFFDIILYVSDIFSSLSLFVGEIFPKACSSYFELGFFEKLPIFYTLVRKNLKGCLKRRQLGDEKLREMMAHVEKARINLLNLTSAIIQHALLQPLIDASFSEEDDSAEHFSTTYFHALHSLVDDRKFVDELKMIKEMSDGVVTAAQLCPAVSKQSVAKEVMSAFRVKRVAAPSSNTSTGKVKRKKEQLPGKKVAAPKQADDLEDLKLVEAASIIIDIFPDMKMAYVKRCLRYFNCDTEKLTQAVLENNLPPHLESEPSEISEDQPSTSSHHIDRPGTSGTSQHQNTSSSPEEATATDKNELVFERRNVFNNDEFDVFGTNSNRVDLSRVQQGKDKLVDTGSRHWKDDKFSARGLNEVHRIVTMYDTCVSSGDDDDDEVPRPEHPADVIPLNPNYVCDYEDERDDFGDEYEIGVNDDDSAGEGYNRRQPPHNNRYNSNMTSSTTHSNSSNGGGGRYDNTKRDFVRNPADMRAEREQKYQQNMANNRGRGGRRGGGGGNRGGGGGAPSSNNDQKQAQDRHRKDQNKASRANHNRKAGATRKMASAMR